MLPVHLTTYLPMSLYTCNTCATMRLNMRAWQCMDCNASLLAIEGSHQDLRTELFGQSWALGAVVRALTYSLHCNGCNMDLMIVS